MGRLEELTNDLEEINDNGWKTRDDWILFFLTHINVSIVNHWRQMIVYLNNEENRYLAEFRDALLPDLMSGKIEVKDDG